jgi:hypothetical protein
MSDNKMDVLDTEHLMNLEEVRDCFRTRRRRAAAILTLVCPLVTVQRLLRRKPKYAHKLLTRWYVINQFIRNLSPCKYSK